MNYSFDPAQNQVDVRFLGFLTYKDADRFLDIVRSVAQTRARRCRFDLSQVDFIDSTGISLLLAASHDLEAAGIEPTLCNPSANVRRVFTHVRLLDLLAEGD